jgi:hypothetical protein
MEIEEFADKDIHEVSSHSDTGTRYLYMKMSFDMIEPYYTKEECHNCNMKANNIPPDNTDILEKSFLRIHLRFWIRKIIGGNTILYCRPKYGLCHVPLKNRSAEDGRRELPTSIYKFLKDNGTPWKSRKVTLTWICCYLNNVDPDCFKLEWETFQCSHRCLGAGENLICLNSLHLVWESSADNQSRGSTSRGRRICCIICKCDYSRVVERHTICVCYKIHDPPCCEPYVETL